MFYLKRGNNSWKARAEQSTMVQCWGKSVSTFKRMRRRRELLTKLWGCEDLGVLGLRYTSADSLRYAWRNMNLKKKDKKCKKWNEITLKEIVQFSQEQFCHLLYSVFLEKAVIWLHSSLAALGLLLGQYANNNTPKLWLSMTQSTCRKLH